MDKECFKVMVTVAVVNFALCIGYMTHQLYIQKEVNLNIQYHLAEIDNWIETRDLADNK